MSIAFDQKKINTLAEIEVSGKRVFCRLDLNVPIENETITDVTRIEAALPTLKYLLEQKALIVIGSHLGRPKGKVEPKYSLLPVAEKLSELLGVSVIFPDDCIGDGVKKNILEQRRGEIILLENLRFHPEEEKNDLEFAKLLKNTCDVFVTDAFGALHRAHASTAALPQLFETRAVGVLVEKELEYLGKILQEPKKPFALILGGAKISDKMKVIENMLKKVDHVLIGGAMAFTFLKSQGKLIGKSFVENDCLGLAQKILSLAKEKNVSVHLPKDFVVASSITDTTNAKTTRYDLIEENDMGLDIGPKTVEAFIDVLEGAQTVFWNGPMGLFETPPFDRGTNALAKALSEMSCVRIIGGGDSAAAVEKAGVAGQMTHISTGGGASLVFLEGKALPGLVALAQ